MSGTKANMFLAPTLKQGLKGPLRGWFAALFLVAAIPALHAQEATPASVEDSRSEYERISREVSLSAERMEEMETDIAAIRKDHATITAALIQSAKTEKKLSQDIDDIGGKLEGLKEQEEAIRLSLNERRGVLAEVLGALQRMGLNPPPAILVKPEDALSSVRSAILLGAVVPELRSETKILLTDLKERSRIVASIETERARLVSSVEEQAAEKKKLELLQEEKLKLQGETETALAEEQRRSEELAARAGSLQELIASFEKQAEDDRKAQEAALKAETDRQKREDALAALPNANSLVSTPFSALKAQVSLPVPGRVKQRFGAKDGNGGVMQGDMLATQSGAIVTAPADGTILYAGPFRSYGQLLILNAGDGYHIVLAGMTRISVASGQAVLSGEPIGAMGEARVASTSAAASETSAPELYVEFRKDGKPVDPTPWWAERLSGRTGNDT
ncbi:murein hydrolase activator EnvC [Mesorhizobium sp. SB112]|uniref:murein hydrolase activator EnvC family protein n=1 Tax=Mesorhizobium sp. SB112 TaxID=3151853 RepID=UPI0032678D42